MNADMLMERALFWAERGRGRTSPNPIVGAVVVSPEGVVVGQGAHLGAGGPHAEVHALDAAGRRARGATLYCTLEPCSHTGLTPPCVERIVAAGVARVVAAVEDPNPRVHGRGFAYLRGHGVHVDVGPGAARAIRQNEAFRTWVTRRRPFVTVKVAVSADGFVGRADRRVQLTGADADRWFQRQRAEVDALAVGAGTVLVDDPRLTPREVFRLRPLTRVVFDWRARVPPSARLFSTLSAGPVIMVMSDEVLDSRKDHVRSVVDRGATVVSFPSRDLAPVLTKLADEDVLSLLVEGGPSLQTVFAGAALVDRVQWVTTPHVLGDGVRAPAMPRDAGHAARTLVLGADTLTEFDVHGTD